MKKFVADRLYIERVNAPFLAGGGSGEDFRAGIERAIELGWRRGRQCRIAGYARHLARVSNPMLAQIVPLFLGQIFDDLQFDPSGSNVLAEHFRACHAECPR